MNRRGKNTQPCEYYFRVFHSLCPVSWVRGRSEAGGEGSELRLRLSRCWGGPLLLQVQRWNEQIKQGTFPGKI